MHTLLKKLTGGRGDSQPMAIDLGSHSIRVASLTSTGLAGSASVEVPAEASSDFNRYLSHLPSLLKQARSAAGLSSRTAHLVFPSFRQHWLTLRLPKLDPDQIAEALKFEVADKLPFDPAAAMLRHTVAGEVHTKDGPRLEVIVCAARRSDTFGLISAVEKAGFEPKSLRSMPDVVMDGIRSFYRREGDETQTWLGVDIGRTGARAFVTAGDSLYFARGIDFDASEVPVQEEAPAPPPPVPEETESFAMLGAAMRRSTDTTSAPVAAPKVSEAAQSLATELVRCRRYHDAGFADKPVSRLIFFGGGALNESLCREVARQVSVAAQVGDFTAASGATDVAGGPVWSNVLGAAASHRGVACRVAA